MTGPAHDPAPNTTLILGGTAEARELAAVLVAAGCPVVSSLAGRVSAPRLPVGGVRIGGFGGAAGMAAFLREHAIASVVDATHPFAATISDHAVEAARLAGVPLLRLARPGWGDHPGADRWTWVSDATTACAVAASSRRPFLTTGRQSLAAFIDWADRPVLARVVEPPDFALPARWRLIESRGPYSHAGERRLLTDYGVDTLITKDSGGTYTVAKLDVASALGVPVVVISRPPSTGALAVTTVTAAVDWLAGRR